MLKQYLLTSLRYLVRNKGVTLINVAGLTLGITFSILIGLYVKKELSVDKSFLRGNQIYRIEFEDPEGGRGSYQTSALGPDLKNNFSGIDNVLRIQIWDQVILRKDDNNYITIPKLCLADSSFFDFFEQSWIYGSPENSLNKPRSIVLTDNMSKTIFGDINPVGRTLLSQSGNGVYTITGVIKKREDSHINYDALLSLVTRSETNSTILHTYSTQQWLTYFMIGKMVDIKALEEQIYKKLFELIPYLKDNSIEIKFKVLLNPLKDIYFDRHSSVFGELRGNYNLVRIFIAVAILIIIIACINFINLSTAIAVKRAKEVGLRKLAGAKKITLISRFLAESLIISFIATLSGVLVAELLLPYFNNLIGCRLDITYFDNSYTIPLLMGIVIVTGFLAGFYPAYYISSYDVIRVIKGEISRGRRSLGFRRGLILFQFFITVILINGSLLISKQIRYTRETDLGFEKERIMTIDLPASIQRNGDMVRKRLLENPQIEEVSYSYSVPGSNSMNYEEYNINNKDVSAMVLSIDPYYIKTMGIEVVKGRNFDEHISSDSVSNCIINETLAAEIGLENPVNESFHHDSWYITMFPVKEIRIIGIVKDFHFKSFRTKIEPLILCWNPNWNGYMNIKIHEGGIPQAMETIRATLSEFAPGIPMDFKFVDDSFDLMYKSDERMSNILIYFTLLAVLISIMGLIGMAVYLSRQRLKEIAILKTYGASVTSVIFKLTREFILLVAIGNSIAWPVVLWLATKWLNEFAYKTNISIGIFIIGAFVSVIITLITVVTITIRAASANPADSLRYE